MIRKGCIFPVVFTLVIVTAVLYYILTNYGYKLFDQKKIEKVVNTIEDIDESIELLKPSQYKDSLIIAIAGFKEKIKEMDININLEESKTFIDSVTQKATDGLLDSLDFNSLKKMLENYER